MNVLIDLDGTLTDPATGIFACLREALHAMGRACPRDDELRRYIGPPMQETIRVLLDTDDAAEIETGIRLYRKRYSETGLFENVVYPGIPEALAALKAAGATLRLSTSKPRVYAARILEHFDLARYFKAIYGAELDGRLANKAELIAHILKSESFSAASACMIGDRSHDVVGAKANGVRPIGVLWGYGTRDELLAAGASMLCERPEGLGQIPVIA